MKSSFIAAGFTEDRCRYTLLDNSTGNIYNPTAFNTVKFNTEEPYIIVCHQDILLNQGDGFDKLVGILKELDTFYPQWAIAGNAGVNQKHGFVSKITDPNSHYYPKWVRGFPYEVQSLDENFLVIRNSAPIACNISTFYFYGHELCLDAITKGHKCYVIDFHLTHLSPGKYNHDGQSYFSKAIESFHSKWNPQFVFRYYTPVYAPTMCFSRYKVLRIIGSFGLTIKKYLFDNVRSVWMKGLRKFERRFSTSKADF